MFQPESEFHRSQSYREDLHAGNMDTSTGRAQSYPGLSLPSRPTEESEKSQEQVQNSAEQSGWVRFLLKFKSFFC